MSQTTDELKQEMQKTLGILQTLRDEVRVKIHLAGMDAKDEWSKIEDELVKAEQQAERVTDDSYNAIKGALAKLRGFRSRLPS